MRFGKQEGFGRIVVSPLKPIEGCFRVEPDTLLLSQLSILIQPPGERPHKTNNRPRARVIVQKSASGKVKNGPYIYAD